MNHWILIRNKNTSTGTKSKLPQSKQYFTLHCIIQFSVAYLISDFAVKILVTQEERMEEEEKEEEEGEEREGRRRTRGGRGRRRRKGRERKWNRVTRRERRRRNLL